MAIRSINPATGDVIETFAPAGEDEIEAALAKSADAFERHRRSGFADRARRLLAAADVLTQEKERLARLVTEEMGKTLAASAAEIDKCAWVCRYYAAHAEAFMRNAQLESDSLKSYIRYLPLGPLLAVMPWNFPFWQVFRCAAPAVMAGNVVLLKHASNVPRVALALQEIFAAADFAPGVFQTLFIEPRAVETILADPRVKAATVTGSTRAGASVASIAGKHIKKTVLELGGSDAFIVMPSANLDEAVEVGVKARTLANGQSCIAAKRFIVHADVYDDYIERFVGRFAALRLGDPLDAATDVGPLALARTRERLDKQVTETLRQGAQRLTGAQSRDGPGNFYEPGVLAGIPAGSPCHDEEVFGPVALMFKAQSLEEAIAIANDNRYGLGSAIWTNDRAEAERAIDEIEAGATFVNALVASDPRAPFGGVKSSGYGRELSKEGMHEFVNIKTVTIA